MTAASAVVAFSCLALLGVAHPASAARNEPKGRPATAFPLVSGRTQAVIVQGDAGNGVRTAWRYVGAYPPSAVVATGGGSLLQKYVEQSTGRKLRVIPERQYDPAAMPFAIFVGNTVKARELFGTKLEGLDTDGYIVHVAPRFIILAGNVDYAESDFLRTYLGIDSYVPAALFTVVPKHASVTIPVETRVELPVFASRAFSSLRTSNGPSGRPDIPWRMHAGSGRYQFHHNIQNIISGEEYGRNHPEYFALIDGRRVVPPVSPMPFPCISNPGVAKAAIAKCRAVFEKSPQTLSVSLAADDTGEWCECPSCRALDGTSASANGRTSLRSNRYYGFLNQVARAIREPLAAGPHPWAPSERYIGTLAYWGTELPPSFPVERNIIPYICDQRAGWADPARKMTSLSWIQAWTGRVDRIGIYEYLHGAGFSVPRIYTRELAKLLRFVGNGRPGSGFYAELYSNHALDGPKAWITEKLLWNPNQDVDALMTQWASGCFGPASTPMKRYFDLLEETWRKRSLRVDTSGILWGYKDEQQFELFRPEDLPPLWTLLKEAKALAGNDDTLQKRIAYFGSTLRITDTLVRQYHAHAQTIELADAGASVAAVVTALLRNDRAWVDLDPWNLIALKQSDGTSYVGGPIPSRATRALEYIFDNGPWRVVSERLRAGVRDRETLVHAAQDVLLAIAPPAREKEPRAKARMSQMLQLAKRIVTAPRTAAPPRIDGTPDEELWKWVEQPWFVQTTGSPHPWRTSFAWSWDDEHLYLALRCADQNIPVALEKNQGTVEVFIDPGEPNAAPGTRAAYHLTATALGEVTEVTGKAVSSYRIANDGKETWTAEIALRWKDLGFDTQRQPWLRINLMRSPTSRGSTGTGLWFTGYEIPRKTQLPSSSSRGWLVLQP